jgi:hypothetical protein
VNPNAPVVRFEIKDSSGFVPITTSNSDYMTDDLDTPSERSTMVAEIARYSSVPSEKFTTLESFMTDEETAE